MSGARDDGRITLEIADRVGTIRLDRPEKLNALTPAMLNQLGDLVAALDRARDVDVVVVRGNGERAFCVGADIAAFAQLDGEDMWREWVPRGHRVFDALASLRQPTIAVLHAPAFGGGLELALACDFRVAQPATRLAFPEVGLGTVPGWGGTERLPAIVGVSRAKEMLLARRELSGLEAHEWGLVNRVVGLGSSNEGELAGSTADLVADLLGGSATAVQLTKQLVDAASGGGRSPEAFAAGLAAGGPDLARSLTRFTD